ncbi:MAG: hypothetical protein AAB534_01825 [Patescibacteria group bacterium]
MFIIDVIPIAKGILHEKLTYFSAKNIPLGSLVEIPVRKKMVKALVIDKRPIADAKSQIKGADFRVKKINSIKMERFLPSPFIETIKEVANFFASTSGAVLGSSFPKTILENLDDGFKIPEESEFLKNSHEKLLIQASDEERFSTYKSLIREEFAKDSSVLFIVPTIEDIKTAREFLEKGIENYTFCLNNGLKKKELIDLWKTALLETHPVLVIATPQFMYLPRADFNIIIIEKENSSAYRQLLRPYLDMRVFAEILSKKRGVRLLFGDTLLRTETLFREKNLEFADLTPLKFRAIYGASQSLAIFKKNTGKEKFSPLTPELIELLNEAQKNKTLTFIYGSRKGLNPLIQCQDCGESFKCPNCSAPITLHEVGKERFLLCHKCNHRENAKIKCGNCDSWRLQGTGIGLELFEIEIKKSFPNAPIFLLDKETEKTGKQARAKIAEFLKTPGAILIGGEMALLYLDKKIDNVVCGAIDSLFSIPDFRINEKILSLLLRLRSKVIKNFLIQTRHADLKIWQYLLEGNLIDFYREEIGLRETLGYPPFKILIKITIQGKQEAVERETEKVVELFKENAPLAYPSFISKVRGQYIMNVLLKMPPTDWPDKNIIQKLNALSLKFIIKVDPENIL